MDSSIPGFPFSIVLAAAFCAVTFAAYRHAGKLKILTSPRLTTGIMGTLAVLTAVEGTWKLDLQYSVPFIAAALVADFLAGIAVLHAIRNRKSMSFTLSHLGLFLILFGAIFGAPDFESASLTASMNAPTDHAVSSTYMNVPLDFEVTLKDFSIDFYKDGISPRQYTSTLEFTDKGSSAVISGTDAGTAVCSAGKSKILKTSVNHPCLYRGWLIYQSDYDHDTMQYSVLRIVRDPWLPVIFLGMAMLVLGAVMGLRGIWHSKAVIPAALVLAIIFGIISMARISLGTLMPALRSLWFVPHLIVYMIAYSLLAIALVCSTVNMFKRSEKMESMSGRLLSTASALLVIGMLCGAVWAQMAWGDWWAWDPKECWAAVTWLITLMGTHAGRKNRKLLFAAILVSFLSMQVTWYGVNRLPSASRSMHTYTAK